MPLLGGLLRRRPSSRRTFEEEVAAAPATTAQQNPTPWLPEQTCSAADECKTCEICLENYTIGEQCKRLPCLHIFHSACINSWLCQASTCPQCRMDVYDAQTSPDGGGGSRSALATIDPLLFLDDNDYDPQQRHAALTQAEQDDAFLWQAYLADQAEQARRATEREQMHRTPSRGSSSSAAHNEGSTSARRGTGGGGRLWGRLRERLGSVSSTPRSHRVATPAIRRGGDPFPSSPPAAPPTSRAATPAARRTPGGGGGSRTPVRSQSMGSSSGRRHLAGFSGRDAHASSSPVTLLRMGRWQLEIN